MVGQEHTKQTLRNSVQAGSFGHAYLFSGPRGTGKTSLARILARAINCENPQKGEPCNGCDICRQFLSGTGLDLVEIDAASNTGVENIREIIENLKFSPTQAKYKVFIIDEVHMLSKGAFNALLKTLEEPPKHAVFILATTEAHKIPLTVVSRTQRYDFRKIENAKIFEHLKFVAKKEKIKIDDESLQLVANASEGSLRDALSILEKLSAFGAVDLAQTEQLLGIVNVAACQKLLDLLAQKSARGALEFISKIFADGTDPIQFNKDFLEYLRKVLLVSMGGDFAFALDKTQLAELGKQAKNIRPAQLLHIIRLFLRANKDFQISPSDDLPIQIAIAEACLDTSSAPNRGASNQSQTENNPPETAQKKSPESETVANENISKAEADEFSAAPVNEDAVLAAWPAIMEQIKEQKSTFFIVMKNVSVASARGNILEIKCSYKFHKDSIDKNKEVIAGILRERFGANFRINAVLEKKKSDELGDASSLAVEIFGNEAA